MMSFHYDLYSYCFFYLTLLASSGVMYLVLSWGFAHWAWTPLRLVRARQCGFLEIGWCWAPKVKRYVAFSTMHGALSCMQACSHSGHCMVLAIPCVQGSNRLSEVFVSQSFCCVWQQAGMSDDLAIHEIVDWMINLPYMVMITVRKHATSWTQQSLSSLKICLHVHLCFFHCCI